MVIAFQPRSLPLPSGRIFGFRFLFLTDGQYIDGNLRLALYELKDKEFVDLLIENKNRIEVILSNASKERNGAKWHSTNQPARTALHDAGVIIHDRMFNNNHRTQQIRRVARWRQTARAAPTGPQQVCAGNLTTRLSSLPMISRKPATNTGNGC
jgi:hypothetical protein